MHIKVLSEPEVSRTCYPVDLNQGDCATPDLKLIHRQRRSWLANA